MNKAQILADIDLLKGRNSVRYNKYLRNARLYTWSPSLSLRQINSNQVVGYYDLNTYGEDNTSSIQENIIASCIDTLVSKIASCKVRPFFNTIRGSFQDIKVAKQCQQYFDVLFDQFNVTKIVTEVFRDACIFDTGVIWLNENFKILRCLPWLVYTDPAEKTYDKLNRIAYETKTRDNKSIYYYYNLEENVYAIYDEITGKVTTKPYTNDRIPFLFMHYNNPLVGNSSTSITDMLYGIQMEIDQLLQKIEDASKLNPAMTFFIPEGSTVKTNQLDNRVGNVITYKATPNMTTSPVTVSTPAFIDPQYLQLLDQLKRDAFEIVGISQLSAQGLKPQGLDSGKALTTMENIESSRYETQVNAVVRLYTDLTRLYIDMVDPEKQILPTDVLRQELKWEDVKHTYQQMNLQFSGADSLSKDPETKLRQLQVLASAGLLPQSRIATLMEVPDLETGYSISNNALNAVLAVIDDCIENDIYEVPFYIPLDMLKTEIANTILSLKAADSQGNKEDIDKLVRLYTITFQGQTYIQQITEMEQANEDMEATNEQMMLSNESQIAQFQGEQGYSPYTSQAAAGVGGQTDWSQDRFAGEGIQ